MLRDRCVGLVCYPFPSRDYLCRPFSAADAFLGPSLDLLFERLAGERSQVNFSFYCVEHGGKRRSVIRDLLVDKEVPAKFGLNAGNFRSLMGLKVLPVHSTADVLKLIAKYRTRLAMEEVAVSVGTPEERKYLYRSMAVVQIDVDHRPHSSAAADDDEKGVGSPQAQKSSLGRLVLVDLMPYTPAAGHDVVSWTNKTLHTVSSCIKAGLAAHAQVQARKQSEAAAMREKEATRKEEAVAAAAAKPSPQSSASSPPPLVPRSSSRLRHLSRRRPGSSPRSRAAAASATATGANRRSATNKPDEVSIPFRESLLTQCIRCVVSSKSSRIVLCGRLVAMSGCRFDAIAALSWMRCGQTSRSLPIHVVGYFYRQNVDWKPYSSDHTEIMELNYQKGLTKFRLAGRWEIDMSSDDSTKWHQHVVGQPSRRRFIKRAVVQKRADQRSRGDVILERVMRQIDKAAAHDHEKGDNGGPSLASDSVMAVAATKTDESKE